jgi:phospholipase/carboxylesterase
MMRIGPAKGAQAGIVLAHGRGGSAADILGLIAAAGLSEVAAIAPQAPGQSWWPTSFLAPTDVIAPFLDRGIAAMAAAVQELQAEGLARDQIWLAGFSQGACLALETFARNGEGLAGVFGFSGGLIGTSDKGTGTQDGLYGHRAKAFDYQGRRDRSQAWLSVHAQDPHIPLLRVQQTESALRGLGAVVDLTIYPGAGHGILQADLAVLRARLTG